MWLQLTMHYAISLYVLKVTDCKGFESVDLPLFVDLEKHLLMTLWRPGPMNCASECAKHSDCRSFLYQHKGKSNKYGKKFVSFLFCLLVKVENVAGDYKKRHYNLKFG